ncbi:MAG: hypothetical protein A2252_09550 [Elusimicrobia bacterium RIFOXYA2_FULL_39_19]|nr:MAG: hypothetical protein A2252_09550 [Elusimicrobia bacterium RIFOXYA2_FULL_39_19]
MDKLQLLKVLKERINNRAIRFPANLGIEENNNIVRIDLTDSSVIANMQTDDAAFESWILCMKAILDDNQTEYRFALDWNPPVDLNNKHYQRFLYRVFKFNTIFGGENGWFSLVQNNQLNDLVIQYTPGNHFVMNSPTSNGTERINVEMNNEENMLENAIIQNPTSLINLCNIRPPLERQLPVGVFRDVVATVNAIFPHGHSAIDLWGIGNDNLLNIFELKIETNNGIGVLSELFFYTMLMDDVRNQRINLQNGANNLVNTEGIVSYILEQRIQQRNCTFIHPMITEGVFVLLNNALQAHNIAFGSIVLDETNNPVRII